MQLLSMCLANSIPLKNIILRLRGLERRQVVTQITEMLQNS